MSVQPPPIHITVVAPGQPLWTILAPLILSGIVVGTTIYYAWETHRMRKENERLGDLNQRLLETNQLGVETTRAELKELQAGREEDRVNAREMVLHYLQLFLTTIDSSLRAPECAWDVTAVQNISDDDFNTILQYGFIARDFPMDALANIVFRLRRMRTLTEGLSSDATPLTWNKTRFEGWAANRDASREMAQLLIDAFAPKLSPPFPTDAIDRAINGGII
ncbi:MAG: hypothetical protein ABI229_06205 [Gemmatimonadaceae bacterium]